MSAVGAQRVAETRQRLVQLFCQHEFVSEQRVSVREVRIHLQRIRLYEAAMAHPQLQHSSFYQFAFISTECTKCGLEIYLHCALEELDRGIVFLLQTETVSRRAPRLQQEAVGIVPPYNSSPK